MVEKKKTKKDINKDEDNDFLKSYAADIGGEWMSDLVADKGFIDLGALSINFTCSGKFCNGGLPRGTLAEVIGPSGSGKTLVGMNFLKGVQRLNGIAISLDCEHAINPDFAKKSSKVGDNILVLHPTSLQEAFNVINQSIQQLRANKKYDGRPIGILYDSIAVSPSKDELAETTVDMERASDSEKKKAGVKGQQPGERARICSRELRKLMPIVAKNDATVLFINQFRKQIGVYGNPDTAAGGGEALKFYCHTRFAMKSRVQIKDKNEKIVGVLANIMNTKSRNCDPFMIARDLNLMFRNGIDPFGGLLDLLIQDHRIEGESGNYIVSEPWAGGKQIKFKASKVKNSIPIDVLLECPALVDAKDKSEIEYYINLYSDAIADAQSDNFKQEIKIENEEE